MVECFVVMVVLCCRFRDKAMHFTWVQCTLYSIFLFINMNWTGSKARGGVGWQHGQRRGWWRLLLFFIYFGFYFSKPFKYFIFWLAANRIESKIRIKECNIRNCLHFVRSFLLRFFFFILNTKKSKTNEMKLFILFKVNDTKGTRRRMRMRDGEHCALCFCFSSVM